MRRLALTMILVASVLPHAGCARSQGAQGRTPVTASATKLQMSPQELRIRVRAQIRPVLGMIEEGVDDALADVTAPDTRSIGLKLKIEATSTLLSAMLRNDPLLALADAWGYVIQLEDFVGRPGKPEQYGQAAVDFAVTLNDVDRFLFAFADGVQGDLSAAGLEATLRKWAAEHPIEGSFRRRPSMDEAVADLFAVPASRGGLAAIGGLDETTAELMTRMDLYTTYLPRRSKRSGTSGSRRPSTSAKAARRPSARSRRSRDGSSIDPGRPCRQPYATRPTASSRASRSCGRGSSTTPARS